METTHNNTCPICGGLLIQQIFIVPQKCTGVDRPRRYSTSNIKRVWKCCNIQCGLTWKYNPNDK